MVVLLAQGVYFFLDPSILEDVFGESQQAQQPEQGAKNFKVISNNGVLQLEVLPRNSKITVHGKEGGTLWKKLPVGLPLKIKIEAANFQVFETELVLTPEKLERRIPVALRPLSTSLYAKIKFSSSSIQNAKILLDGNIISRSMPTEWFTLTPFEYHTVDIATISKSYQTILGPFPPSCKVLVKYNQNQGGALVFSEININFDPKDKDLKLFWLKGDKQKLLCSEACQAPQYLTGVPPFDLAVINADGKTVKQQKVENSNPIDFIP